jgi:ferredoxin, 2Fe-2S
MVRIVFIEASGARHVMSGLSGRSVMQVARDHLAPFLIGECGGSCICASCHAFVEFAWLSKLPPVSTNEAGMLDALESVRYNSRLTCQIILSEQLDGIVVRLPADS